MSELALPFLILVIALILLVAEDLLPTGGALGILAGCCLVFLLYLGFSESMGTGWRYLAMEAVFVPTAFWTSSLVMTKTGLGRVAYLRPPELDEVDLATERPELGHLVGLRGRALTTLRPSGMVDFDGRRLDGMAEEGLIPTGSPILAVQVRSGRLIVRIAPEEANHGAT